MAGRKESEAPGCFRFQHAEVALDRHSSKLHLCPFRMRESVTSHDAEHSRATIISLKKFSKCVLSFAHLHMKGRSGLGALIIHLFIIPKIIIWNGDQFARVRLSHCKTSSTKFSKTNIFTFKSEY